MLDADGMVDFAVPSRSVTTATSGPFINVWTSSGGAVTDLRIERIEPIP